LVERIRRLLAVQAPYQREIDHAATPAEEVEGFLTLNNEVKPHGALGQRAPLAGHRADQHLLGALTRQEP
jgi:hypothetical protein